MNRMIVMTCAMGMALSSGYAASPEERSDFPVSKNLRGHENIEWSTSYAYHLSDEKKALPRVLLVGDSICQAYQGGVSAALEGKMSVTYWASSYCLTSPCYMRLLSLYLDEAEYSVVHFNNGCHSLSTGNEDWEKGLRGAFALIRRKQPNAKVIWTTITPNGDPKLNAKVMELNAIAAKVVVESNDIVTDDLFALMNPLDRKANWRDAFHFNQEAVNMQIGQVVEKCLRVVGVVPSAESRR